MTTFLAVGDLGSESPHPEKFFAKVAPELQAADLTFGQLELTISDRGARVPQVRHTGKADPSFARVLKRAGFDCVGWASNHTVDWGAEGCLDTLAAIEDAGLVGLGAGPNLEAARRIRVQEISGIRVAVLAYCSILPQDYWATEKRPGCAPLRAFTHYEQIEHDQPGTPARIRTFPHPDDLRGLEDDVRRARGLADVVIVSMHWGLHFIPAAIAEYQPIAGRAAIDAGADLVIGHHSHILKGVEMYRGRAIFYGIGNFALELPMTEAHIASPHFRELLELNADWEPSVESQYNFPHDSRKTIAVTCKLTREGVSEVGFRPAYISLDAVPEFLKPDDPRFDEVVRYMSSITHGAGLDAEFTLAGDQVMVGAGAT